MNFPDEIKNIKASKWPKGSEWRRWDLHIHTPESKLGSPFPGIGWDEYVTVIDAAAEESKVVVIGVTDYMSIDGYEKLYYEKNSNNKLTSVELLIPNIELRMMPPTDDGKAINLHILVDPIDPNHIDLIKRALKNLKFEYKCETYGCCEKELIEFAKKQNPTCDDITAYKYGISQFKPDRSTIEKWFNSEAWLRNNSLIGISNGKDGISGLPQDGFAAIRDELLCWCDFVLSGNPSDRDHYLGLKDGFPPYEIKRQYKSLKPCIHGSDAHNIEKIFKPDHERYCWIKSDPTFNGLRQILWEPGERIYIGKNPPQPSDKSQIISKMHINNSLGWFSNTEIEMNSGLVTIVGEKGSGKTAFMDLAALAAGIRYDRESKSSFINNGKNLLSGLKVSLEWVNGETSDATLVDKPYGINKPKIRYLSQDFVERLCSSDHGGNELQKAIEEVIFSKLDEIQKEGYSSFEELKNARDLNSNSKRDQLRGDLASIHKEIERLQNLSDQKPVKLKTKESLKKEILALQKQLPEARESVDEKIFIDLESKQALKKEIEESINELSRRKRTILDTLDSYVSMKDRVEDEIANIINNLSEIEGIDNIINILKPKWNENVEKEFNHEVNIINRKIIELKGTEDDDTKCETLLTIQKLINKLNEQLTEDENSRKRLLDLQKQISEKNAIIERLDREISNINHVIDKNLKDKLNQQIDLYIKVFNTLKDDEINLEELYAPMQEAISQISDEIQFSLKVGYQADINSWIEKAYSFFDGRRAGTQEKRNNIEKIIDAKLVPAWKSGDLVRIKDSIYSLSKEFDTTKFISKYCTQCVSLVDLFDWMFSTDHINLSYKIQYAGSDIECLSPGTRGIALLILYLIMDDDDNRPLFIDQPEGNLDSSSIFRQLVPYIKEAKKRRQIVLVTHNPNLVIATDSEQVIIATAERSTEQVYPCIKYDSGSLEHSHSNDEIGVKEAVCILLEGGVEAFKVRENRYEIKNKL